MKRVLVANRGEIAVRVIRACHDLGLHAVVVHSDPDATSLAVELADDAVALIGSTPGETYLDIDSIVAAAIGAGCDAVHPGYGFLAERADFAAAISGAGLTWVGPSADVIALMGDKLAARQVARDAGVPLVPGATLAVEDPAAVIALGEQLGWPLTVKAVHGGGGRGMRVLTGPDDAAESLAAAQRESASSFGRPEVYVERFLEAPRHVEVQLIADHHGTLVIVGDRDCSIQRRYQKLIEEAPAPHLAPAVREGLADAARRLATAVGYTNAGTVEFLVDGDELFFLEMNTRIQVEHPVTELVSRVDLVAEQLSIADGRPLSFGPDDVHPRGAAIEVRINAEDASGGRFLPSPGTVQRFRPPVGAHVRVDTGLRSGDELTAHYDNLIAKIVVWGSDREDARLRAISALASLEVEGVPTTGPAAAAVLGHEDFRRVAHSTRWLEQHAATILDGDRADVKVLGRWYRVPRFDGSGAGLDGAPAPPAVDTDAGPARPRAQATAVMRHGDGRVLSPMQGTIIRIDVQVGDTVRADTRVAVLEAMKMENNLLAGAIGVVTSIPVSVGTNVAAGTVVVEVTPQ
jgi:acetyl-CoA/propionyl-CoA carboxylase biotin carboxyl carrier protein